MKYNFAAPLKSRISLSEFNQLVIVKNKHKCSFFLQFISVTYSWGILQFNLKKSFNLDLKNTGTTYWTCIDFMIVWIWTWKVLGLPYWARNDFICRNWPWEILELPYWIWIDFICLWYIGLRLEKHLALGLPHLTWIDFIKYWAWIN